MTVRRSLHGTTAVARASLLLLFALLAAPLAASAQVQTFETTVAPIVRVNIKSGDVTIRTWDRESVAIEADPALEVLRHAAVPASQLSSIPIPAAFQQSAEGPVSLPPESFVTGSIPPGPREAIVVRDPLFGAGAPVGPTPVTITIPADSAFVFARTGDGTLDVHDYRLGTFVGFVGRGRMQLDNVGGTVFVQTGRAAMVVTNSSFERLRARSLFGNMTFERCSVRQIEATSVDGSIVYDGGGFEPGLAHFESTRGDVAVGTSGPVQFGGHAAAGGRVFTNFARAAQIDAHGSEGGALVGGGGPVVTATSANGNVFFYDGTLRTRQLSGEWEGPLGALQRPAEPAVRHVGSSAGAVPAIFRERFPQQYPPRIVRPAQVRPSAVPLRRRFRNLRAFGARAG